MGCDIHVFVERCVAGTWELVPAPTTGFDATNNEASYNYSGPHPYRWVYKRHPDNVAYELYGTGENAVVEDCWLAEWFSDRNYWLFGMLAGVRSWEHEPVVDPRGIPIDASPEIRRQWSEFGEHTPSWLTLAELQFYFATHLAYSDAAGRFPEFMQELAEYGDPEKIRIVFYFDS